MDELDTSIVWPKFKISLTKEQTTELGRLTVTWGQIDHFVLCSVAQLLTLDLAAAITLIGDATTGVLINRLRASRDRIRNDEIRGLTKTFCEDMGPLITKRNHIMHGIWGFYLPTAKPADAKSACFYAKEPKKPLFPDEVTKLTNDAARQTHVIARIWHHLAGIDFPDGTPNYFFGSQMPEPPEGTKLIQIAQPPMGHPR